MRSHSYQRPSCLALVLGMWLSLSAEAPALSTAMVIVGDPANIGNPYFGGQIGSVDYVFAMGKYEITAGQYTEFLNAVAATDTYYLYSTYMDTSKSAWGCGIMRSGSPGNYTYSVAADLANRPVNSVSWGDAARFANWLTNGQPSGSQNATTTEDWSYALYGASYATRKPNARFVLPNWSEWNKAAYYDPAKPGGPGYWYLPTRSDSASNDLSGLGSANANFWDGRSDGPESYTLGPPYYRTEVGTFAGSPGPWGTFDQGGNVDEWSETLFADGISPLLTGGSFFHREWDMHSIGWTPPTAQFSTVGFRVAIVPEPGSWVLILLGWFVATRRARVTWSIERAIEHAGKNADSGKGGNWAARTRT